MGHVGLKQAEALRIRRAWRAVPATVLKREHLRWDYDGLTRWRWSVRYAYEVDGRRLESDRLDVLHRTALIPRPADHALVQPYQAGQAVAAYVDPADPSNAVLEPRVPYLGFFIVAGLTCVTMGGGIAVAPFRPSWTRFALLVGWDLLTLLFWIHPRLATASTGSLLAVAVLSLPAVVLTARALFRRRNAAPALSPSP